VKRVPAPNHFFFVSTVKYNPEMNNQADIKQQLVRHLEGGQAFSTIETVLRKMPFEKTGVVPEGLPYSFYQLFAHIRIAQLDILEYCTLENYAAGNWPDDYWPDDTAPESRESWTELTEAYFSERKKFCELILNPETDLMKPFEANKQHNLFRQAGLIIEHTAYHTGQLYIIHRLLNT
jgi:hypothetical protein